MSGSEQYSAGDPSPQVVKIAEDGAVTLSMPELAGQYLVIEQERGEIVLKPFDLRWQDPSSGIAKIGSHLHFVRRVHRSAPEV